MKRLQITLAFALLFATLFTGCGPDNNNSGQDRAANGPVKYGGVFRMNENEDFRTLYPIAIVEVVGSHIGSQVYEGLVKFDQKDLHVMPGIAYRWDTLDNSTRFVFHLRKGVLFHDNACFTEGKGKGREVTAADVKFCFDQLCTVSKNNLQFANTFKDRVAGANEYFEATEKGNTPKTGVSGITAIDDSTLEVKLTRPMPGFTNVLCTQGCWIYAHEAFEKYGDDMRVNCVGTGPFRVKIIKEGESVSLERNPNYWMYDEWNNRLPYLDYVEFKFIKDKRAEIIAFRNKELDMVFRLPVEMAKDILGELEQAKEHSANFALQTNPAMSLTYFGFQNKLKPFDDVRVRQAFNYSIDRQYISEKVLQGDASPGIYGIVPPSMLHYDYKGVTGYSYDPEKARKLLAEAGYPGGKGFPEVTLQINNGGGDRNNMTAEYVTNKLKENLGITVKIEPMPFTQHIETVFTGKSLFWRFGWVADYPDPETFLTMLYSRHIPDSMNMPSSLNSGRYSSPQFDSIFEAALVEADATKRAELFRRADQVGMNDAAIMPIYYEINDRLVQRNVRGFDINPMEYRDMTKVWFDNSEEANAIPKVDTTKK